MTDTIHPATTPAAYDPSPLALALPLATISASSLGSIGSHRSDSSVSRRGTQSGPHHTLTVTGSQATSSGAGAQAPASTSAAATTAAATLGRTSSESRASMTSKSELEEAADTVRPLTANHTTKRRRSRSQGSASEDTATFSPIISPTFDPYAGAVPGENYCLYPGPRPRSSSTPAAFQAPRSLQASAASLPLREYSTKSSHHFSSSKADLNASGIQRRNTEQYKTRRSWFARWFGCCATVQPGDIITVRVTPDDAYGSPT
ncbi:hypothetical protein HK105_207633 [Polyrhizophydium stewartii]|uniref:Uncharacterized protein n=1 Tax=Polyrhizophydium stewartii TaxID=2732419 RepID=A0ABR4MZZ7_9FUNG